MISMQIMYILFCFICRKVEDLQFQIEEEAISKDDLEVTCCYQCWYNSFQLFSEEIYVYFLKSYFSVVSDRGG